VQSSETRLPAALGHGRQAQGAGDGQATHSSATHTLVIAGQVVLMLAYRPPVPPEAVVPCDKRIQ
jgi:hypothetical protein